MIRRWLFIKIYFLNDILKPFNSEYCMVIQFTIPSLTKASPFYFMQRYKNCPGSANLVFKHVNLHTTTKNKKLALWASRYYQSNPYNGS